jgi:hypothetical protein
VFSGYPLTKPSGRERQQKINKSQTPSVPNSYVTALTSGHLCGVFCKSPHKAVILNEAHRRSIANRGALWRGVEGPRRCSLGRCFCKLSGRSLQRKIRKSQTPTPAEVRANETAAIPRRSISRSTKASRILPWPVAERGCPRRHLSRG